MQTVVVLTHIVGERFAPRPVATTVVCEKELPAKLERLKEVSQESRLAVDMEKSVAGVDGIVSGIGAQFQGVREFELDPVLQAQRRQCSSALPSMFRERSIPSTRYPNSFAIKKALPPRPLPTSRTRDSGGRDSLPINSLASSAPPGLTKPFPHTSS